MKILLHEVRDRFGVLGIYECDSDLSAGMTVALPSGATCYINKATKTRTSGSGDPLEETAIYCAPSDVPADSAVVIQPTVSPARVRDTYSQDRIIINAILKDALDIRMSVIGEIKEVAQREIFESLRANHVDVQSRESVQKWSEAYIRALKER